MVFIAILLPLTALAGKPEVNYDEQIVVTFQPDAKLKKAFKGIDLSKVKDLKIKSAEGTEVNFWECYSVLKKMPNLKVLDLSECHSLQNYLSEKRPNYDKPLPIQTLVLRLYGQLTNPIDAIKYYDNYGQPIFFGDYTNLQEVIVCDPNNVNNQNGYEEEGLYTNVYYENGFVPIYYPKAKIIRYKKMANLSRPYQIIIEGRSGRLFPRLKRTIIPPTNKLMEGVVAADASFMDYLPAKLSKFCIPSSVEYLLGDYNDRRIFVDTLTTEESDVPLIIKKGGLYALRDIKFAYFNRPVIFIGQPGVGIFSHAEKIVFNKFTNLHNANLGYSIKEMEFNGKTEAMSTIAKGVGSITFNEDVSMTYDPYNSSSEVIDDADELIFKRDARIDQKLHFGHVEKVFVPVGFNKECHSIFRNAKEMDFEAKTVVDPRITPKDGLKIKPLRFDDKHLSDVEQAGSNRFLYINTRVGKNLNGYYYVPVSDNLYLSFSTENLTLKGNSVRMDCGPLYNLPGDVLKKCIMVFSYIPVKNENGIEYGHTTGFYIVDPKYGEVIRDLSTYATMESNRKTPYVPPTPKKKTYHEHGRVEDCAICLGTGQGWGSAEFCPFCGGKGWYIEHEW